MDAAAVFAEQRPKLFGVAYRMLGSVADAEDMVQETYLRWQEVVGADTAIDSPSAYLTTMVSRRCLDELRSARRRREEYVGEWLPAEAFGDLLRACARAVEPGGRVVWSNFVPREQPLPAELGTLLRIVDSPEVIDRSPIRYQRVVCEVL